MERKITIALVGAGQRGTYVYSDYINRQFEEVELVAVAEKNSRRRKVIVDRHGIESDYEFDSWERLFDREKFCDAVIIATSDDLHFEPICKALEKGYHILIEKPISNKFEEIKKLDELAGQYKDRIITVSHVLRYTKFFQTIKNAIESGEIGELITIQHNENIGYYHAAHSYVRGNWKNKEKSSPLVLAKCCHDMDILLYLVGDQCKKLSSFGSLKHFKKNNMPKEASNRCLDCKLQNDCAYSATKIYLQDVTQWPANIITDEHTIKGIETALRDTDFGLCVYDSDNDVVDHQVSILEFQNGVTATLNISAFTHDISRTIKVMGSKGEIRAHMDKNVVEVYDFLSDTKRTIDTTPDNQGHIGHGGGDEGLVDGFIQDLQKAVVRGERAAGKTSLKSALESHFMSFAAEESRVEDKIIYLNEGK